jgi:hypothetical protein
MVDCKKSGDFLLDFLTASVDVMEKKKPYVTVEFILNSKNLS